MNTRQCGALAVAPTRLPCREMANSCSLSPSTSGQVLGARSGFVFPKMTSVWMLPIELGQATRLAINDTLTTQGSFLSASWQLLPVTLTVLYCLTRGRPCAKLPAHGHAPCSSSKSPCRKERSNIETQPFQNNTEQCRRDECGVTGTR